MQVTKETWRMREQCVPGSLSSSPAQEPGNEAMLGTAFFDHSEFEAMKSLSGWVAARCDEHQFVLKSR